MIVEYAQLLSTTHRMIDGSEYTDYSKNGRKIKRYKLENPNAEKIIYHNHVIIIIRQISIWGKRKQTTLSISI